MRERRASSVSAFAFIPRRRQTPDLLSLPGQRLTHCNLSLSSPFHWLLSRGARFCQRHHLITILSVCSQAGLHSLQKETFECKSANEMQPHVSSCKPLKKRDVRPFVQLMDQATDSPLLQTHQPVIQTGTPDSPDSGQQQLRQHSVISSRRSSDSGIATADPSDSDSPHVPEARTPGTPEGATKELPQKETAKRTPFCGRCRNHWPDNPVLVRGEYQVRLLLRVLDDVSPLRPQEDLPDA